MPTTIDQNLFISHEGSAHTGGLKKTLGNVSGNPGASKSNTALAQADVQVDIQQASRLMHAEASTGSGHIQNREQAESVVAKLRGLFEQNPASALGSFRIPGPAMLSSLLNPP